MKPTPRFYGIVKDGKLVPENKERMTSYIRSLEGKMVSIEIEQAIGKRTLNQNALYWAYLRIIEDETGNDSNDLHEVFKEAFLGDKRVVVEAFGKTAVRQPSTARQNKQEFSEYMAKIEQLTGVPIPDPNEIMLKL